MKIIRLNNTEQITQFLSFLLLLQVFLLNIIFRGSARLDPQEPKTHLNSAQEAMVDSGGFQGLFPSVKEREVLYSIEIS